ncbi:MAG: glycosyltransferase family 4 protein [Chthoniobacterales bacterium]
MAEALVGPDTRVVVVTSEGAEAGGRREQKQNTVNGVEVIRVGGATFTRQSHWRRALSYSGLYPQLMRQVWKLGKVDAVISMTDPPLQVAAVTLASWRARKKIHWAQDVYPELAEELGVISRGGILAKLLRGVSNWALMKQEEIVAVGECMRRRLLDRGIGAQKIEVIPNWTSVSSVSAESIAGARTRMGWNGKFVALYSGNLGLAHDFETLLNAARLLQGGRVAMAFAGEGPRLEEIKQSAQGATDVGFLPPQPKGQLDAFLASADVHLVSVRAGLQGLVVPSKIYGILAAGRPVMYVGPRESEVAKLLIDSGAGLVFANGDSDALADALNKLSDDPDHVRQMSECAAQIGREFTLGKSVLRWQSVLEA